VRLLADGLFIDILEPEESLAASLSQKQRSRSVSSAASYSQMTAVFNDVTTSPKKFPLRGTPSTLEASEALTVVHAAEELAIGSGEISDTFAALNVAALHNLGGGDVLLEVCDTGLVYLRRYRVIYEEDLASSNGQDMKLPTSLSDVSFVRTRSDIEFGYIFLNFFFEFCDFDSLNDIGFCVLNRSFKIGFWTETGFKSN